MMRVFIDATAAATGGLGTYARGLLRAWGNEFSQDRLRVAVGSANLLSSRPATGNIETSRFAAGPGNPLQRLAQQNLLLNRLSSRWNADVFLSLLPQLPVFLSMPSVAIVHDLWHEIRPNDFTLGRRLQRHVIYSHAYRRASALVTVSSRTRQDLLSFHSELQHKTHAVLSGCDHITEWDRDPRPGSDGYMVAFGHHDNKRPDLALGAWLRLRSVRPGVPPLVIAGLRPAVLDDLQRKATAAGAGAQLMLRGHIPDFEFQSLFAGASALLFTSVFEGLGLPVLEAMRLGIPLVICPDPGLLEAAGGHAEVAHDWTTEAISAAAGRALDWDPQHRSAARSHALAFTWLRTVVGIRDVAQALLTGDSLS